MTRIEQLFQSDWKARGRMLAIAILAAATVGILSESEGLSTSTAQILSTLMAAIALLAQASLYVFSGEKRSIRIKDFEWPSLGKLVSVPIALAFVLVLAFLAPDLRAQILNGRLRKALIIPSPLRRTAETKKIFTLAYRSHTPLDRHLVSEATNEQTSPENVPSGSEDVQTHVASKWSAYLNEANEKLKFAGEDIEFTSLRTVPGAFSLDAHAVYQNVGLSMMNVLYFGGSLTLDDVTFSSVTFFLDDSPNSRELVQAVTEARGKHVSLTLKGQ